MARFVDRVVLHAVAGDGGHGCASIHREKFKPLGGPDGGNGGTGGNVVLVVDSGVHTLLDFHYRPHAKAGKGKPGMGSHRHGAAGEELELAVPEGTMVLDDAGAVIADLTGPGTRCVVATGGHGGLGNAALASRQRKAPGFALLGEPGEALDLTLELKSVADVGLVGFPSAGKSSLVSALSAARPKIAEYPFTTLTPNLGVVTAGGSVYTIADVPGLIPGASEGKGLGLEFLRHVERCAVLVHVVDCATMEPGRDPLADVQALEDELWRYGQPQESPTAGGLARDLMHRPRMVALTKIDVPDAREMAEFVRADLEHRGWPVFAVSTASHEGLRELSFAMAAAVEADRAARPEPEGAPVLRPTELRPRGQGRARRGGRDEFAVYPDPELDGGFVVTGSKPERWIRQTDFDNDEAVGYLADRLARLGVEEELAREGAVPGAPVTIGDLTFDWEPTIEAGAEIVMHGRGNDPRLATDERTGAAERKRARNVRRGHAEPIESEEDAPDGRRS